MSRRVLIVGLVLSMLLALAALATLAWRLAGGEASPGFTRAVVVAAPPEPPRPPAPSTPDPHGRGSDPARCLRCHDTAAGPTLVQPLPELCRACHPGVHGAGGHPVTLKPASFASTAPGQRPLPLGPDGRSTCITCHDPHGADGDLLRLGGSPGLCQACHRK